MAMPLAWAMALQQPTTTSPPANHSHDALPPPPPPPQPVSSEAVVLITLGVFLACFLACFATEYFSRWTRAKAIDEYRRQANAIVEAHVARFVREREQRRRQRSASTTAYSPWSSNLGGTRAGSGPRVPTPARAPGGGRSEPSKVVPSPRRDATQLQAT